MTTFTGARKKTPLFYEGAEKLDQPAVATKRCSADLWHNNNTTSDISKGRKCKELIAPRKCGSELQMTCYIFLSTKDQANSVLGIYMVLTAVISEHCTISFSKSWAERGNSI